MTSVKVGLGSATDDEAANGPTVDVHPPLYLWGNISVMTGGYFPYKGRFGEGIHAYIESERGQGVETVLCNWGFERRVHSPLCSHKVFTQQCRSCIAEQGLFYPFSGDDEVTKPDSIETGGILVGERAESLEKLNESSAIGRCLAWAALVSE